MTQFDPNADPETRRAEAEFEMRRGRWWDGCSSGCTGWLLALTSAVTLLALWP
ncbi:MAG: hypothetical protein ACREN5_02915 [Gemmatimonadales bacterium]